jgi:glutathione S-transferase
VKLFWSSASPYARKVMIVLHELNLLERVEVIDAPKQDSLELQQHNPLGKIPTLITDDGECYFDSNVICEYLDVTLGRGLLIPASGPNRWMTLTRRTLGDGMIDAGILIRNEVRRSTQAQSSAIIMKQSAKIEQGLRMLEKLAAQLGAAPFDIGHITIACAVEWLDFRFGPSGKWRQQYVLDPLKGRPRLTEWHASVASRKSLANNPYRELANV